MTDGISVVSLSQRRIRHLRSVAGRNIAWCEEGSAAEPRLASAGSVSSSVSSSVVTSRAPSPELQYSTSLGAVRSQAAAMHRRTGSDGFIPPESTSSSSLQPLVPYPSASAVPTGMRRSESVSSMQSCSSATVEDSSMTKSAYKLSRSKKLHSKRNSSSAAVVDKDEILSSREERGLLDIYMTLQLSTSEPPFYKSETIPNTISPSFKALDPLHWTWYDGVQTTVVARLWARHSFPESAALASISSDNGKKNNVYSEHAHHDDQKPQKPALHKEEFQLLIEWQVDLNALAYIGKTLQEIPAMFPENTIIFEFDDGFYTAPDIASILVQSKKNIVFDTGSDAHEDNEASTTKIKRSYTYNHLVRLNTLKDCIFDTQKSVDDVRQQVQDILIKEENRFRLVRECSQRQIKLEDTERCLVQKKNEIRRQRQRIAELKKALNERERLLKQSFERLQTGMEDLKESESLLDRNVHMHQKLFHQLNRVKKELIADLFSIYPIEQFRIRGIHLPNSVYTGCDEEMIATALGFTAHLVQMLAFYLEIPLRYPIVPMGSRATIKDPISLLNGAKEFPLYSKGVDKYRFEFGVFLLNKNIEQMMNAYGLIVMDLRHTLPNIHYFIQAILTTSVSTAPSSISVLSISSYANQPDGDSCKPKKSRLRDKLSGKSKRESSPNPTASDNTPSIPKSMKIANGNERKSKHEDEHHYPHHLTLQPVLYDSSVAPSPSTSNTSSVGRSVSVANSPKIGSSPNLMSKAIITPTLESVTTNSSCNRADKKNGAKKVGKS